MVAVNWKESIHLPISLIKELVEVNRHAAGERSDAMNRHAHLMTPAGVGKAMQAKETNKIDHIIAVMSGKGGVGKSLVTSLAGIVLKRSGFEVGILDADITGPSIPVMFGINKRPEVSKTGLLPVMSSSGIAIMSINLMLECEDDPVIWRGPLIGNTIKQFWEDVLWGKLDYLLIDLPPGTSDAPLTVMQSLPLSGVVIVFTPQELASMVVRKAIKMSRNLMNIPIMGVVENMSYFVVPETGKTIEIFGRSRAEEMARVAGAPLLGRFPIDPELAMVCDAGQIEGYNSEFLNRFSESFLKTIKGEAD